MSFDHAIFTVFIPLVIGGALGGIAQALIVGNGRIKNPQQTPDSKEIDFGWISDIFIGIVSALASIVIGLTVLNNQFFADGQTHAPPVQNKQEAEKKTDSTNSEKPTIPSWMRILSFGALMGFAGRRLLPSLSAQMAGLITKINENEDKINDNKNQINEVKNKQENTTASIENLQSSTSSIAGAIPASLVLQATDNINNSNPEDPKAELELIVKEYDSVHELDKRKRVAQKQQIAEKMLSAILRRGIKSNQLFEWASVAKTNGWCMAVAVLVCASPGLGDAERILKIVPFATWTHSQYKILLACFSLLNAHILQVSEISDLLKVATVFADSTEPSLSTKAKALIVELNAQNK